MKRHISTTPLWLTLGVLLMAAAFAPFGFAQTQTPPPPQYYRVQVIRLNPGMRDEWLQFYQTEILPVLKKGGVKQHTVLVTTYGDIREYSIISPVEGLAQLDEPGVTQKVMGQASRALNMKHSRFFADWHVYLTQARPDLGITPTSSEPAKMAVRVKTSVTPGRTVEYEKWLKENLTPIVKQTNAKGVVVGKTLLGGDPNTYTAFVLFDSFADLGKFQAAAAKAAAELKLSPTAPAGMVAHTEWTIVSTVPELSIRPSAPKAGDKE